MVPPEKMVRNHLLNTLHKQRFKEMTECAHKTSGQQFLQPAELISLHRMPTERLEVVGQLKTHILP